MDKLFNDIQRIIDENMDSDVNVQRELLEPLFNQVYNYFRSGKADIKDMLKISQLENQLTKRIIDVEPIIAPSSNANADDKEIEQLVYYSRKKMESTYNCSVVLDSLRSRSLAFCNIILEIAKNLNIPACMFNLGEYFHLPFKHYVVIACLNKNYYIIDLTYQQYFLLGYNFKNRYYEHPSYTRVCEIGGIMLENNIDCATKMIRNGYLKDDDIKRYFDAFLELGSQEKLSTSSDYLKTLLISLKGSNDKRDKILYSNMNF